MCAVVAMIRPVDAVRDLHAGTIAIVRRQFIRAAITGVVVWPVGQNRVRKTEIVSVMAMAAVIPPQDVVI